MFKTISQIFARIPRKWIVVAVSAISGILLDRISDAYISNTPFVGWPRVEPVLIWATTIVVVYFFFSFLYQSVRLAQERSQSPTANQPAALDTRKPLPVSELTIGTFEQGGLAIDILAKIVLGETSAPSVAVFLQRIVLHRPYCPKCKRTLDTTHADWMADGVQTGFECRNCGTQRTGVMHDLYRDVEGAIRRSYDDFWDNYSKQIREMTNGKADEFRIV